MKPIAPLVGIVAAVLCLPGSSPAQQTDLTRVLMRLGATYRACQSVRIEGTWTRKIGDKEVTATVALAAQRPNLYRLELQGPDVGTDVASDGRTLTALRPQRKAYTQVPAPQQIVGYDILKGIDMPAAGVQLTTLLLQGMWRDARHPLARRLLSAELSGPVPFGDRLAYVLKFDYSSDYTARAYVTSDDYVLRRVALYRADKPEIVETFSRVEFDKSLSPSGFALKLPEEARKVASLPPVVLPAAPTPITIQTIDDRTIAFDSLRGKVVLVSFFFTTCPYCNEEMPYLQQAHERFKDSGLEVIALNGTGETKEAIKQWAEQHGITFSVGMNKTTTDLVGMFKVTAYPTNVVFDREGKVVYKKEGFDAQGLWAALGEAGFRLPVP